MNPKTPKVPCVVIYTKENPNPCPRSDADGHYFDGKGMATPIYHESHVPPKMRTEPVPGHKGYYYGGPK
jgi:hypothetical protein